MVNNSNQSHTDCHFNYNHMPAKSIKTRFVEAFNRVFRRSDRKGKAAERPADYDQTYTSINVEDLPQTKKKGKVRERFSRLFKSNKNYQFNENEDEALVLENLTNRIGLPETDLAKNKKSDSKVTSIPVKRIISLPDYQIGAAQDIRMAHNQWRNLPNNDGFDGSDHRESLHSVSSSYNELRKGSLQQSIEDLKRSQSELGSQTQIDSQNRNDSFSRVTTPEPDDDTPKSGSLNNVSIKIDDVGVIDGKDMPDGLDPTNEIKSVDQDSFSSGYANVDLANGKDEDDQDALSDLSGNSVSFSLTKRSSPKFYSPRKFQRTRIYDYSLPMTDEEIDSLMAYETRDKDTCTDISESTSPSRVEARRIVKANSEINEFSLFDQIRDSKRHFSRDQLEAVNDREGAVNDYYLSSREKKLQFKLFVEYFHKEILNNPEYASHLKAGNKNASSSKNKTPESIISDKLLHKYEEVRKKSIEENREAFGNQNGLEHYQKRSQFLDRQFKSLTRLTRVLSILLQTIKHEGSPEDEVAKSKELLDIMISGLSAAHLLKIGHRESSIEPEIESEQYTPSAMLDLAEELNHKRREAFEEMAQSRAILCLTEPDFCSEVMLCIDKFRDNYFKKILKEGGASDDEIEKYSQELDLKELYKIVSINAMMNDLTMIGESNRNIQDVCKYAASVYMDEHSFEQAKEICGDSYENIANYAAKEVMDGSIQESQEIKLATEMSLNVAKDVQAMAAKHGKSVSHNLTPKKTTAKENDVVEKIIEKATKYQIEAEDLLNPETESEPEISASNMSLNKPETSLAVSFDKSDVVNEHKNGDEMSADEEPAIDYPDNTATQNRPQEKQELDQSLKSNASADIEKNHANKYKNAKQLTTNENNVITRL